MELDRMPLEQNLQPRRSFIESLPDAILLIVGWPGRRRFTPSLKAGLAVVSIVLLSGLMAPVLAPSAPDAMNAEERLLPPGPTHPFGTDQFGRDMLSRVAHGARIAAGMAGLSGALAGACGLLLGSVAGYYGGWSDQLLSRAMDVWLGLPGALVAILVVARLGPSLNNLVIALGLMGIPAFYRLIRASTISAKCEPYVEAALCIGAGDPRILWRHILPNVLSPLIVLTTLRLGLVLLTGGSLSFIGLGAQPPLPEWGAMLASGRGFIGTAWWLAVFPGLAMTFAVLGLNLLGDGLRDALDPQMRG